MRDAWQLRRTSRHCHGGTRGIGAAITQELAKEGAHVAAGFGKNRETAERFCAELVEQGRSVSIHQGNVGNPDDCERVVAEVMEQRGSIDFPDQECGGHCRQDCPQDDGRGLARGTQGEPLRCVLHDEGRAGEMLRREYGRIVNISSVIGETGNIGQANYAASKSGLFGFTKSLALETARKGITVNCVGARLH